MLIMSPAVSKVDMWVQILVLKCFSAFFKIDVFIGLRNFKQSIQEPSALHSPRTDTTDHSDLSLAELSREGSPL